MRAPLAPLLGLMTGMLAVSPNSAMAGSSPAEAALDETINGKKPDDVVQNRFFLKAQRFELSPMLGYVPNNPFVKRYIVGVMGAYHLSERFAIEGAAMMAPDLGNSDLKPLIGALLYEAYDGNVTSFRQPLSKMTLGGTFAARWSPVYGKINLVGESVLNFDFYFTGGLGILSMAEYYATYDKGCASPGTAECATLGTPTPVAVVPVTLGFGMDFFLTGSMALKIDARNYLYVDKKPQYDPNTPETESRIYNAFLATVGVSIFFPKMQPRQFDY
ncbi:MAG: outer membrane beta-barrel domain-containing protein [Oligoflexia bacterium]|nr:outer membrane beta-barrel domain-containing protein [Oligoflexia bacterium]